MGCEVGNHAAPGTRRGAACGSGRARRPRLLVVGVREVKLGVPVVVRLVAVLRGRRAGGELSAHAPRASQPWAPAELHLLARLAAGRQRTVLKMSWLLVANHRLLPAHAAACRHGEGGQARRVGGGTPAAAAPAPPPPVPPLVPPAHPAPHLHRRRRAGRLLVRHLRREAQQAHCRAPHFGLRPQPLPIVASPEEGGGRRSRCAPRKGLRRSAWGSRADRGWREGASGAGGACRRCPAGDGRLLGRGKGRKRHGAAPHAGRQQAGSSRWPTTCHAVCSSIATLGKRCRAPPPTKRSPSSRLATLGAPHAPCAPPPTPEQRTRRSGGWAGGLQGPARSKARSSRPACRRAARPPAPPALPRSRGGPRSGAATPPGAAAPRPPRARGARQHVCRHAGALALCGRQQAPV